VLAWNDKGYGPWSDPQEFAIEIADAAAVAPQPLGPSGAIVTTDATYVWNPVPGAVLYRLSIRSNGGSPAYWWFSPADAGCQATSPCHATPPANLADGTAEWQVQAWTANGSSSWSAPLAVTLAVTAPPAPVLLSPTGTVSASTLFTWNASARATLYYIRVTDPAGVRIDRWLRPEQVGCLSGTGVCTLDAGITLSAGAGTWKMIAWNARGYSDWTAERAFVVQ
jgi:hypothetical protein